MKKYYNPELIDNLIAAIPYEEVLKYFHFPVKGNGKNRGSNCPRCGKDHRHFKINTHRNTAHCFPCGWAGNPIQFIQEVKQIGFIEAVELFAEIGDFPLPEDRKRTYTTKERILYHTVQFYKQFESDYLLQRGIDPVIIDDYDIGYAPGGTKLKQHLNRLSFSDDDLLDAGVIVERHGQLKDFFFQCVVVPIVHHGIIVDLYGRYTKQGNLKHMYLYGDHIAFNLHGLDSALPVIIVESVINALTLLSHGITNVMATGGSHFSKRHARQLKAKNIQNVYIAYDTGDRSKTGQKSAIQAGKRLEELNIVPRIIQMPEDTDINDLFMKDEAAFDRLKQLISDAASLKEYEVKFLLQDMPVEWIRAYLDDRISCEGGEIVEVFK